MEIVRKRMEVNRITQAELAEKLGVDPSQVSRLTRGWAPISPDLQGKVERAILEIMKARNEQDRKLVS